MGESTYRTASHSGNLLAQVHGTYVETRGRVMSFSDRKLRRVAGRLQRRHDRLDQPDLARLRAMRDEVAARRLGC